jgi:protein TonB
MEFTIHPQGRGKNLTGISVVALLHIGVAALLVIGGSRVTVFHPTPPVTVAPTTDPVPPKVEPDHVPMPEPSRPTIFVPVVETPVVATDPPTVTARPLAEKPPGDTGTVTAAGGTGKPAVAPAAPARVAAVVDSSACAKPDYPKNALRNGDTGTVTLALLVGTDGRVADARVEKSSGFRELDRAAQVGLGLCKFKPGTLDGVPYQSWTKMQYVWSLND